MIHLIARRLLEWPRAAVIGILLLLTPAVSATAHSIIHRVQPNAGIGIELQYSGSGPLVNAPFRIYRPGTDGTAFQTGHTDRWGRLAFLPDRAGNWRIAIRDQEGHEAEISVPVAADGAIAPPTPWGRWLLVASLTANLGLLLLCLQLRRTTSRRKTAQQ